MGTSYFFVAFGLSLCLSLDLVGRSESMAGDSLKAHILGNFRALQSECQAKINGLTEESMFLSKCLMKCQGVTTNFPTKALSKGQISYYVQQYAEAVLDYTYHDETHLTDEEFPEKNSRERIANIFAYFEKVKVLCQRIVPTKKLEDVLGSEIAECLHWRRGALLYMYCSTVQEDKDRLKRNLETYSKDLKMGIKCLQTIFEIRGPELNQTEVLGNSDTLSLLKMGIYSDTHLLALMYAGEMCYWYTATGQTENSFDARSIGADMLSTYVKAIEDLPQLQGWSKDRAVEILTHLKS